MEANNQIILDLQKIFEDWRSEGKNRTIASLARKAKMNYQEVRRTIQGEISPTFKNTAPLIEVMSTPKTAISYYEQHFPTEAALYKRVFKKELEGGVDKVDFGINKIESILNDPYAFHVLALLFCSVDTPISRKYILSQLGEHGDDALQGLINEEIVLETPRDEVILAKPIVVENKKIISAMIVNTTEILSMVNRQVNFAHYRASNEKGMQKALEILRNTEQQLAEVFENPEYVGRIPLAYSMSIGCVGKEF